MIKETEGTKITNYVYDGYAHVIRVYKDNDPTHKLASYAYDEKGMRIAKTLYKADYTIASTEYYIRDLSGNVLCTYSPKTVGTITTYTPNEYPMYGGSRIGRYVTAGAIYEYELTDHLGNVRVVFHKNASGAFDTDEGHDYYPFGLSLGNPRSFIGSSRYKHGFQGQYAEKDDETGHLHFDLRDYDPVIGRWMSPDPAGQYYSPYVGMGNNPSIMVDPDGGTDGSAPIPDPGGGRSYPQSYTLQDIIVNSNSNSNSGWAFGVEGSWAPPLHAWDVERTEFEKMMIMSDFLIVGQITSGAVKTSSIITKIASKYRLFQCKPCADKIIKVLKSMNIKGEVLEVTTNSNKGIHGNIWSDVAQQNISTNGTHKAVLVDGKVYDNINPLGVNYDSWVKDLFSPSGYKVTSVPF